MKILNKLTFKHMYLNKKRSIVTAIGIMLSTALMLGIGIMFSSAIGSLKQLTKLTEGNFHLEFKGLSENQLSKVIQHKDLKEVKTQRLIGVSNNIHDSRNDFIGVSESSFNNLKDLQLLAGRLPTNNYEIIIPSRLIDSKTNDLLNKSLTFNVGDFYLKNIKAKGIKDPFDLKVDYIKPSKHNFNYLIPCQDSNQCFDAAEDHSTMLLHFEEYKHKVIRNSFEKTYMVVGIYQDNLYHYNSINDNIYTLNDDINYGNNIVSSVLITRPTEEKLVSFINLILDEDYKELSDKRLFYNEQLEINYSLLAYEGVNQLLNIDKLFNNLLIFILVLISTGSIIVIYNSFAISAIERKREFGLYSSIGATRNQIKHSIYLEALILGAVGIGTGIIVSIVGGKGLIWLINYNLSLSTVSQFKLFLNFTMFIIPILFMIVVVYLSAMLPARRASVVSPMILIKQSDDIKITSKEVKISWLSRKLFKAEGLIASKNMKRNKKRYRIALMSLVTSTVLFITLATFTTIIETSTSFVDTENFDLEVVMNDGISEKNKSLTLSLLEEYETLTSKKTIAMSKLNGKEVFDDKYIDYINRSNQLKDNDEHLNFYFNNIDFSLFVLSDADFEEFINQNNLPKSPIIKNNQKNILIEGNNAKLIETKIFKEDMFKSLELINNNKLVTLENIYFSPLETINGFKIENKFTSAMLIINNTMYKELEYNQQFIEQVTYVKTDDPRALIDEIKIIDEDIYTLSSKVEFENLKSLIFVIRFIVYTFVAIIAIIGITSIFNTIYTSITLRRKEFAMLRSVGLSKKGFNRMLTYESLIFSFKTLALALPISFVFIILINIIIAGGIQLLTIIIPFKAILIASIAVFTIIFGIIHYSARNIKKENILESLRREID